MAASRAMLRSASSAAGAGSLFPNVDNRIAIKMRRVVMVSVFGGWHAWHGSTLASSQLERGDAEHPLHIEGGLRLRIHACSLEHRGQAQGLGQRDRGPVRLGGIEKRFRPQWPNRQAGR